jgi:hypothetical protein
VKAAIDYFAAKQVHENPRAPEEDDRSQDQTLIQVRKDDSDFAYVAVARLLPTDLRRQPSHQQDRHRREQINEDRALPDEVLSDFEPHYRRDLTGPERPLAFARWPHFGNDFG